MTRSNRRRTLTEAQKRAMIRRKVAENARKKKNNKPAKRFQPHFRKAYNEALSRHPQYIYGEEGKTYKTLGLTSSPSTDNIQNIPLSHNPEPNNTDKAYLRPNPNQANKKVFGSRLKGWRFCDEDKKTVQAIIDKHEKKKK